MTPLFRDSDVCEAVVWSVVLVVDRLLGVVM